jgi:hypothetical protein
LWLVKPLQAQCAATSARAAAIAAASAPAGSQDIARARRALPATISASVVMDVRTLNGPTLSLLT